MNTFDVEVSVMMTVDSNSIREVTEKAESYAVALINKEKLDGVKQKDIKVAVHKREQ